MFGGIIGRIIIIALGVGLIIMGNNKRSIAWNSSNEPLKVDLTKLESGQEPKESFVRIGPHVALWNASFDIYNKQGRGGERLDPNAMKPSDPVAHCYVAIVSNDRTQRLAVIVKTEEYETYSQVPVNALQKDSVQGVIIGRADSLEDAERAHFSSLFPSTDMSKVYLLEKGSTPASAWLWIGLMIGGVVVLLIGVWPFISPFLPSIDSDEVELTQEVVDRIAPHTEELVTQLNEQRPPDEVIEEIAAKAGIEPEQVAMYVKALIEAQKSRAE